MSEEPPLGAALRRSGAACVAGSLRGRRSEAICRKLLLLVPRLRTHFDPEISHQLERLAARAWPADEVHEVEGWLLRRTEGVDRRRCNSLLPPPDAGAAARTAEVALTTAEELGFATVVQVAPAEAQLPLDEALEARGMTFGGPSLVLAGPLRSIDPVAADITIQVGDGPPDPGPVASPPAIAVQVGDLDGEWVEAWETVSGLDGTRETAELVLAPLGDRARFATAVDAASGRPLGVGVGVTEDGWLGLFALTVTPDARRRGTASTIVETLESWAATAGAQRVYLQVEADNDGALAFYGRRGFHIAHSYHYRSA
jgi:GNAT superfamily N-acetyltransferase